MKEKENLGVQVMSTLPTSFLEFTDGTNWFQLATQNYVNVVAKLPCMASTTGTNLTATYSNGTSGVGATLTNSGTNAAFVLDGITLTAGQRVLIKDQTTTYQNGVYTVTNIGSVSVPWVLTRATDFDSPYLILQGSTVVIALGTTLAGITYMQNAVVTTIGTSAITFSISSEVGVLTISGTTSQIVVSGTATNPIIGIASNPVIPGTAGITLPGGTAAQRSGTVGTLRYWNGA